MRFVKNIVVVAILIETTCLSNVIIEKKNPKEKTEIIEFEEAAINLLTSCYANQENTIVVVGDFPGNFIKKLSSEKSISLVFLDDERRVDNYKEGFFVRNELKLHKVHVVLSTTAYGREKRSEYYTDKFLPYWYSIYFNTMAPLLVLDWPSNTDYSHSPSGLQTFFDLCNSHNTFPTAKLMGRSTTQGIVIYTSNLFKNEAPEPWKSIPAKGRFRGHSHLFSRKYRRHEEMCKNLDFDKTRDLGGYGIGMAYILVEAGLDGNETLDVPDIQVKRDHRGRRFYPFFLSTINAKLIRVKTDAFKVDLNLLYIKPRPLLNLRDVPFLPFCYPRRQECRLIVTQHRGYKTQLEKIYSVIDTDSWIAMSLVYLITLLFFKLFLHEPLMEGIMNVCRLTCNFGIMREPRNVASRVYMGCLLFFVVTMQGIFLGNLASLLTHDIEIRQAESIKDLDDLGYKVYVTDSDYTYFTAATWKGRLMRNTFAEEYCISHVLRDPTIACLIWDNLMRDIANYYNLHVSTECIAVSYGTYFLPFNWFLTDRLNRFLGIMFDAGTIWSFDYLVAEKRLRESEAEPVPDEPKVMNFNDLKFGFIILGIGSGISFIVFVFEIIIYRIHRRFTKKRVIVL